MAATAETVLTEFVPIKSIKVGPDGRFRLPPTLCSRIFGEDCPTDNWEMDVYRGPNGAVLLVPVVND